MQHLATFLANPSKVYDTFLPVYPSRLLLDWLRVRGRRWGLEANWRKSYSNLGTYVRDRTENAANHYQC